MAASLQRRRLKFIFQLATGTFDKEGNPDVVEFTDFRAQVEISSPGGFHLSTCRATIYGMSKEVMDRLSVLNFLNIDFMRNVLTIEATDDLGQFCSVFKGEIFIAQPDYNSAPNVPFVVEAQSGLIGNLAPSVANSFPGPQKVSTIMSILARELGVALENNGVETILVDQTMGGTSIDKVRKVAEAANIQFWYEPAEGVLAIAPMGVARRSESVKISPATGLIGWPRKERTGISFSCLFNPSLFNGCKIEMETDVPSCRGQWYIQYQTRLLSSELPNGPWSNSIFAAPQPFTLNRAP